VNRHFQAKTEKYKNRIISETINPIKPKFEDKVQTINYTSRVVDDYPKACYYQYCAIAFCQLF